jgi:hypothetical protein
MEGLVPVSSILAWAAMSTDVKGSSPACSAISNDSLLLPSEELVIGNFDVWPKLVSTSLFSSSDSEAVCSPGMLLSEGQTSPSSSSDVHVWCSFARRCTSRHARFANRPTLGLIAGIHGFRVMQSGSQLSRIDSQQCDLMSADLTTGLLCLIRDCSHFPFPYVCLSRFMGLFFVSYQYLSAFMNHETLKFNLSGRKKGQPNNTRH